MIFEKVCALIAEQFNVDADSITMDTSFEDDLNADSVDLVDLSMALEEEFEIDELTEEDTASIKTVGDLVRFLQRKIDCPGPHSDFLKLRMWARSVDFAL